MTPHRKTTIVLIDDHELFRTGIAMMIKMDDRFEVVGEGGTSEAAVTLCAVHTPDLLLLDVELNDQPAKSTIRRVLRAAPTTRIIMLTMHRDRLIRTALLKGGATAFLTKSIPKAELFAALALVAQRAPRDETAVVSDILSPRELEVLRLLATPAAMRLISRELGIAEGTVKRHTNSIYRKLEVTSRIQAVPKAQLLGILD